MKAIILAAGTGSRMGALTEDRPKCLVEFLGRPLIEYQLTAIREAGIKDIIVVVGYKQDKIAFEGIRKVLNEEYAVTNMVESFFKTRPFWDDDVILSYGDIVYEPSVLGKLAISKHPINVVVDLAGGKYFRERFGEDFLKETESMVIDNEGFITDLGEPRPDISRVKGQYIGLLKFTKEGLKFISEVYDRDKPVFWDKPWLRSKNFKNGYMTDLIQRNIDLGNKVKAVTISGGWLEFDSEKDHRKYMEWYSNGKLDKYFSVKRGVGGESGDNLR